eukprot:403349855
MDFSVKKIDDSKSTPKQQFNKLLGWNHTTIFSLCELFISVLFHLVKRYWQNRIFWKLNLNSLKIQFEYYYALNLITEQVGNLNYEGKRQKQSIKFLCGILRNHKETCKSIKCYCHQSDSLLWANSRFDRNQQIISIEEEEINFLNEGNENSVFKPQQKFPYPLLSGTLSQQTVFQIKEKEEFTDKIMNRSSNLTGFVEFNEIVKVSNEDDSIKSNPIKINSVLMKKAYFANLMRFLFDQAIKNFPHNYLFRIQYAYFALFHMRNVYLCINILRDLNLSKMTWLERVNVRLNEITFIGELEKYLKKRSDYENGYQPNAIGIMDQQLSVRQQNINQNFIYDTNINPDHFINMAHLYDSFNKYTQILNQNVMEFWRLIIDKNFDLQTTIESQRGLSMGISKLYEVFKKIDSQSKQKDSRIYYFFGIIQKQLMNDEQAYDLMLQKSKSIKNMQRVLKDNYQNTIPDVDIAMITCLGGISNFGKLVLCNQKIKQITGFDTMDLKHQSIDIFMPQVLRECHKTHQEEFNKSGQTRLLNKVVNVFLMKKNGTVAPVNLQIKYHYSQKYDHCFIGFVKDAENFQLWNNNQNQKSMHKTIFLLCDNQDGKILAFTENAKKYLGLKNSFLNGQDVISRANNFTITDVCPLIELNSINKQQQIMNQKFQIQEIRVLEGQFQIDYGYLTSQLIREQNLQNFKNKFFRFKLIRESYFQGNLNINILALELLDQNIAASSNDFNLGAVSLNEINLMGMDQTHSEDKISFDGNGESDLSSSSSSDSAHKNFDDLKSQFIRDERKTPKLLKIAVQFILLVFVAMIVISSVNFYLAMQRNISLEKEIEILTDSYERSILTVKCKVYLQSLILMANGYENQDSKIQGNKIENIRAQLFYSQEQLRQLQSHIDHDSGWISGEFKKVIDSNILALEYLNEDSSIEIKNQSMSFGVNIFVARLLDIYNMKQSQLIGNLTIQTLKPPKKSISPTLNERIIHFDSYNSIRSIREISEYFTQEYIDQIQSESDRSKFFTEMTIIGSICAIALIGIIVIPIMTQIQEKQYIAIYFFFQVPRDKVLQTVEQVTNFYEKLDSYFHMNYMGPEENYRVKNVKNEGLDHSPSMMSKFDPNNGTFNFISLIQPTETIITSNNLNSLNTFIDHRGSIKEKRLSDFTKSQLEQSGKQLLGNFTDFIKQGPNTISESEEDNSNVSHQIQLQKPQIAQGNQNNQEEPIIEQQENTELEQIKVAQLNRTKLRQKCKVFLICLMFIVTLSLYFIGTYLMSLKTYKSINQVIESFEILYQKNLCTETVFAIVRESQIRNTTAQLLSRGNHFDEISNQILLCQKYEHDYSKMRVNIPEAFMSIEGFINDIEGADLCSQTFTDVTKISNCNQANNGILKKGLSNTLQYILSHFQQQNLKMSDKSRNETFMKNLLLNEMTTDLIVMKLFIIEVTLQKYYDLAYTSVQDHFKLQMTQYLIVFITFLTLMVIIMTVFITKVFKSIKLYLWQTNMSLKILPIQYLNAEQLKHLKKFIATQ